MSHTSPPPSPTVLYDSERRYIERRISNTSIPASPQRRHSRLMTHADRRKKKRGYSATDDPFLDHPRSEDDGDYVNLRPNQYARDSLAPPDIEALLRAKRRRSCGLPAACESRPVKVALMLVAVGSSAVQANGVYCWPTYGPLVSKKLGLTSTEAQTIVVGGILGVYLCAAPLGALVDRYGPRAGSLLSALLAAGGYLSFAAMLANSEKSEPGPEPGIYIALTASFFAVGAATVGSYFAALTTASLSFPSHPTLSLSLPLALMGLSSLFLSSFSVLPYFHNNGELNAVRFLTFLGLLALGVNLFGAMFMRVIQPPVPVDDDSEATSVIEYNEYADLSASLHLDERSPLLIGGPEAAREVVEAEAQGKDISWSIIRLVHNPGFWAFGIVLAFCIGPSETIIATVGSVVSSLLPPDSSVHLSNILSSLTLTPPTLSTLATADSALSLRNKHVFILSICSTLARLATGFAADYLCPAAEAVAAPDSDDPNAPTVTFVQRKPIRLTRSAFAAICAFALAAVFAWSARWLDRESRCWVLSGGVGALYGAIFTLSPAIVSSHFGPTNFGLAWGMVSYFPAMGSAAFSYLYAYLAQTARHDHGSHDFAGVRTLEVDPSACYGPKCFQNAFWIAAVGCAGSALGMWIIGRRWRV